jgi:ElaB/YqjD/DUF883 family membrane-anchored ribosome-binding protein
MTICPQNATTKFDHSSPGVSETLNKARDLQNRVSESARQISANSERYVHDYPWMMIGVAALAGCVIGFPMRPRD